MAHLLGTPADLFAPGVVVRVARGWAAMQLQGLWARVRGDRSGGSSDSSSGGGSSGMAGQAPQAGAAIVRVL
jgi:hypothetical protein